MIRRRGMRLDDAERDAAPRQIAGQHEARGTRAGNQNIGIRHVFLLRMRKLSAQP